MINLYLSLILDFLLIITCLFVYHEKKHNTLKKEVKEIEDENKQLQLKIFQVLSDRLKK